AIEFAQRLILHGTRPGRPIPLQPFRLRGGGEGRPSKFQFIIRHEGKQYDYGFVLDRERIHEEWLFVTEMAKGAKEQRCFERSTSAELTTSLSFGNALTGRSARTKQRLEFIAEGTRPNQLFLTEAAERNVAELAPLRVWFEKVLLVLSPDVENADLAFSVYSNREFHGFLRRFLSAAGTGICDAFAEAVPFDAAPPFGHMSEDQRQSLRAEIAELADGRFGVVSDPEGKRVIVSRSADGLPQVLSVRLTHECTDGSPAFFTMEEESDGTQRLIHLLPALSLLRGESPRVLLLDELDRRLHTLLSRLLVEAALDGNAQSQLIFTTHDTNLLDADLLRRDEIWFVEKDPHGASHLYSLAEFKVRPDLKLEKGYLNGRFGAIPFIGDLAQLGWSEPSEPAGLVEAG
ncbi:MAG TPA: AAA family ATPase, partial [Armatimonadota bacterium]|nr:AAA family ATPase [Armatimonadota bacterium]